MNQSFIDGERHGREQAAKEHARMVREFAIDHMEYEWGETYEDGTDPDRIRFADRIERLAQAIEKGAK